MINYSDKIIYCLLLDGAIHHGTTFLRSVFIYIYIFEEKKTNTLWFYYRTAHYTRDLGSSSL